MVDKRLSFGSLFSGIGGFDLGFERAGMRCNWQVEIDAKAANVLAHHWPDVTRYKDVRNVGRNNLEPVDLICGGFPCQDLSVAGKRAGLAGERSGLWFEFHRVIAELRPRWVVIENVPGLLSSNGGRDFAVILRGLVELGHGVCWRVLDAQYFGVAQRRRRVFIVGCLGNGRAAEVLFEREGVPWDTPPSRETGKGTAAYAVPSLTASGRGTERTGESRGQDPVIPVIGPLTGNSGSKGRMGADEAANGHIHPVTFSESGPGWWKDGLGTLRAEGENRPSRPSNVVALQVDGDKRAATLRGFGHGWQGQHNTLGEIRLFGGDRKTVGALAQPGMKQQNYVAGVGVRRITPRECERLQGFHDDWTLVAGASDSSRYRQSGNAVAVPVAEWIGRRIVESEDRND